MSYFDEYTLWCMPLDRVGYYNVVEIKSLSQILSNFLGNEFLVKMYKL